MMAAVVGQTRSGRFSRRQQRRGDRRRGQVHDVRVSAQQITKEGGGDKPGRRTRTRRDEKTRRRGSAKEERRGGKGQLYRTSEAQSRVDSRRPLPAAHMHH